MSISRPAQCLFSASAIPKARPRFQCRNFHASPNVCERRRPRHKSIKEEDIKKRWGLPKDTPMSVISGRYTAEEKEALAKRYTAEQLEVIEEGENAIDPQDLAIQAQIRNDPFSIPYLDDFSKLRPWIDRHPRYAYRGENEKKDAELEELGKELGSLERQIAKKREEKEEDPEWVAAREQIRETQGEEAVEQFEKKELAISELERYDFQQDANIEAWESRQDPPENLPRLPDFDSEYDNAKTTFDQRDPDGKYAKLGKKINMTVNDMFKLNVKILVSHRVVNQTRLGKMQSMYILAIAGNGNGRLGIGEGKATEMEEAQVQARLDAIRNMKPIPRYENRTIFGETETKVSATVVQLKNGKAGHGLRCQPLIFEMARAAGIHDLSAKVPRSRNKMNVVKATFEGLVNQRIPDEIARGLGRKLVDVRKVYYGGDQMRDVIRGRDHRAGAKTATTS